MANDATAAATKLAEFRKSHPIDFSLLDKDDQAVMYISEDPGDWELHLTIGNTSSQAVTLKDTPVQPSTLPNHHFALRFRAGTLSQQTLALLTTNFAKLVQPANWQIAQLPKKPEGNTPVTLYLRYTGASKDLVQGTPYSLKLTGFSAAPGSGSRGTQAELLPNPAQVVFKSDNSGITGSRTQYLHVTNHTGRKTIPLHVGFFGPDQVENGAVAPELTLRITNILRVKEELKGVDSGKITFNGNAAHEKKSVLVLSYDSGDTEWDLGTSIASVSAVNKKGLTLNGLKDPSLPQWVMTFASDVSLDYGESIDILIKNIQVSAKPGHANLYLHYNNIPGYWDGQFVCTVEKGPLIEGDGMVKMSFANNRYLWFRDDAFHKPATNDVGGVHIFGNCSELKFSAGPNPAGTDVTPLKQVSLVTDKAAIKGELTANTITVTSTDAAKPALTVTGPTLMNFGPNGGLLFRGNNNGNPAIMTQGAKQLTICAENGANMQTLVLNAETIHAGVTLVVKDLVVENTVTGVRPVKFEEVTFYYIGKNVPVNGRLDGRATNQSEGATQVVLSFPKPVAKVTAFLAEHHLEFITSADSYDLVERPLSAVGVGALATIDPNDKTKVIVTAWAVLSDNRKSVTDHFQGSAKVVVLASFAYAVN
jgi:hypothetical protein